MPARIEKSVNDVRFGNDGIPERKRFADHPPW
jgi:hypothetical protein